ncbi:hypothetical protein [Pseudomonas brassicacearum]|uniref:Uncharacterized protein n=1 Tax=Pseudomonas brassicacearum TaxID=930166 RepID=A0A423GWY9_9PSED|nr:hypothetical protein [Pseudomonas brassicacearum]RON02126.1 hypothetical protein BK658_07670 [Pseudomonas brassicacearum]
MNKKALNSNKLNITIRVPLKNPWVILVLVILGSHESDMLPQNQARKTAPSHGVVVYHSYNPSGAYDKAQKDYELIDKQIALWEEALAAFRQYEEAKGNVPPDLLELLHRKAKWLAATASSYQQER